MENFCIHASSFVFDLRCVRTLLRDELNTLTGSPEVEAAFCLVNEIIEVIEDAAKVLQTHQLAEAEARVGKGEWRG